MHPYVLYFTLNFTAALGIQTRDINDPWTKLLQTFPFVTQYTFELLMLIYFLIIFRKNLFSVSGSFYVSPVVWSFWLFYFAYLQYTFEEVCHISVLWSSGCWFGSSEAQHVGHGFQEQLEWWRHERCGDLHQHYTVRNDASFKKSF